MGWVENCEHRCMLRSGTAHLLTTRTEQNSTAAAGCCGWSWTLGENVQKVRGRVVNYDHFQMSV